VELQDSVGEVERLARMVDGLLVLARADRPESAGAPRRLDAAPLLAERAEQWRPFADERDIRLEVDAPPGLTVTADPDRLVQVLDNYVANALDAAPSGSTIRLMATDGPEGRAALHVVDRGPGLPAEDRERAFDRFWRADPSGGGLGGSGLGLAIVAKLVHADGGTTRLDAAPGGGIDAVVVLPR
jgi:signal transduction histidine kinase